MLAVTEPTTLEQFPDQSFDLAGKFLGFASKDSWKLKYLRLDVDGQIYLIKIPKEQRLELYKSLVVGTEINCQGSLKSDQYSNQYKAYQISICHKMGLTPKNSLPSPPETQKGGTPIKVLICGKSDCSKQGSQQIAQAFQQHPHFQVQITGCQKKCHQAPNFLVNAPTGKAIYSLVSLPQVAEIIHQYLEHLEQTDQPKTD